MEMGKLYEWVSIGVAKLGDPDKGPLTQCIGLGFPKEDMPNPDDECDPANYEDKFLTLAAAKSLLIDLKQAIDACVEGKPFE